MYASYILEPIGGSHMLKHHRESFLSMYNPILLYLNNLILISPKEIYDKSALGKCG